MARTQPAISLTPSPISTECEGTPTISLHSLEYAMIDDMEGLTDDAIEAYVHLLLKEQQMCDMATD